MYVPLIARTIAGATALGLMVLASLPADAQQQPEQWYQEKQLVTLHDFIRLQDDVDRLDPDRRVHARLILDEAMGSMNDPDDRLSQVSTYNQIVAILNGASPYGTVTGGVGG
jgi:hypothetical protein